MHDKNLKRFRSSLRCPSNSTKRQLFPANVQHVSRVVLHKIEAFDR